MEPLFVQTGVRVFQEVALADIEPPPLFGARTPHGPSVRQFGILTPVELVRAPEGSAYPFQVAAGSRRVHAARDEGMTSIPAFVSEHAGAAADLTGIENLGRSSNPVAEALALREKFAQGYSLKAVATSWGAPIGTLKKRAKLLALPDWLLQQVGQSVSLSVTETIAGLGEPYRSQAVQALALKVQGHPEARFSADDLKAARVAQGQVLGGLLEAALKEAPAPLLKIDPTRDLAVRVAAMARNEGVVLAGLARALLDTEPADGQVEEEASLSLMLPLSPGAATPERTAGPPSRVRPARTSW